MVVRRQLKRRYVLAFFEKLQACLVGIEACASSHHWSRELQVLGHTVRLMPPDYVKTAEERYGRRRGHLVEDKLEEQAQAPFARSPDERRSQIPSIMKSLQQSYKKTGWVAKTPDSPSHWITVRIDLIRSYF
jgi:transposase